MTATEVITRDERAVAVQRPGVDVTVFMPKTMEELVRFASYAAESGLFGRITPQQATVIMLRGYELNITPLQALREIYVINAKPVESSALIAGLIQRSAVVTKWQAYADPKVAVVEAERRDREGTICVEARIENIPAHLLTKDNWRNHPEDMLWAYAVRRMARRHFADVLTGLNLRVVEEPEDIVDVEAVRREAQLPETVPCPRCRKPAHLQPNPKGGAFLVCEAGHTSPPPQAARDAMRGHKEREELGPTITAEQVGREPEPPPPAPAETEPARSLPEDYTPPADLEEQARRESARQDLVKDILTDLMAMDYDRAKWVLDYHGRPGNEHGGKWLKEQTLELLIEIKRYIVSEAVAPPTEETHGEEATDGDQ